MSARVLDLGPVQVVSVVTEVKSQTPGARRQRQLEADRREARKAAALAYRPPACSCDALGGYDPVCLTHGPSWST